VAGRSTIALISFAFFTSAAHAEKLRITSTPSGAKVEINGVPLAPHRSKKTIPAAMSTKPKPLSAHVSVARSWLARVSMVTRSKKSS